MKNRAILALILSVALLFTSIPFVIFAEGEAAVAEAAATETGVKSEIPYCDPVSFSLYTDTTKEIMTADQVTDPSVKAGCNGYVMKLTNANAGIGLTIDPAEITGNEIKLSDLESITVRAYLVGTNVRSTRATIDATAATWLLNEAPTGYDQWIEYSIPVGKLAYEDGETVSPFCLAFRFTDNTMETTVYIDSVTFNMKLDPELGKAEIPYTAEDKNFSIYGYSAMNLLDAAKAEKAGITGIEGDYVMQFTDNSTTGDTSFMLDLRQSVCKDVKIEDVESVTFRVWIPHAMDLRIRSVQGDWNHNQKYTPAEGGGWIKITITAMSTFVDDGNGYFSPFAFTFRNNHNTKSPCIVYFDGVTVKLKEIVEEPTEPETPVEPEIPYYGFADGRGKEEIPYGNKSNDGAWYDYKNFKMLDEAQAKYAGVPVGYSGWVLALDPGTANGTSIGIDLTDYHVKDILKITFRVWCPAGTKTADGVRLSGAAANTWSMLAEASAIGEWIEVVLEKEDFSFMDFDGDGFCDPTNFCFRGATATGYIDSITVEVREPDTVPPVINYEGETEITTAAGKPFVLDIFAYDEYYGQNIAPEFFWSEGAVDESGNLVEGTHTCTVKFTDMAGSSEIELKVTVVPHDTEAPEIVWDSNIEAIFATIGTIPCFEIGAIDNVDEVGTVLTWSEGALDGAGGLTRGLHTLTVTSTDLSGNTAEIEILVYVVSERPALGSIVQDS